MSESVLHLIVQGTLVTLVLFSVATWGLALVKGVQFWRLRSRDAEFQAARAGAALPSTEQLASLEGPQARLTKTALSTWHESEALASKHDAAAREILELRLRQQIQRERRTSESGLAVLASIGTTSPFVGLFGTVWGIMGALRQIGATGEAGIEVVAGPIGEALIATGVGIAVAVPAVLAFNVFVRRLKLQGADLEDLAHTLVVLGLSGKLKTSAAAVEALATSGTVRRAEVTDLRPQASTREASA
ncbi:MAG TPA: MotA/TolQ/ExbB proton channel family protein [Polyangiaceae bacterium]|nr:MotA/TolQ/ExbB proton channel family protein [Polyangiaceae bacterium]